MILGIKTRLLWQNSIPSQLTSVTECFSAYDHIHKICTLRFTVWVSDMQSIGIFHFFRCLKSRIFTSAKFEARLL